MGSSIAGTCRILIKQFDGPSKTSKHTGEGQRMDAFRLVRLSILYTTKRRHMGTVHWFV